MTNKHEIKRCPRCYSGFECKSGTILLCQCQEIILNEGELKFIEERFEECLCLSCLVDLRSEYNRLNDVDKSACSSSIS